jgi:outer membrane protein TolC
VQVPQFPSRYTYNRHDSATSTSVSAVWPIYAGGVADASRGFVSAQTDEAQADAQRTEHELMTQLVQRYFGAQLATRAARLRANAFENVQQHDAATEKMLAAGVISLVERLQARVAFEDARRNALKAQDDAKLAGIALARSTNSAAVLVPDTPLFVLTQPVEPLAYFTEAALQRHPGLAKVAAKKSQAEHLLQGEEASRKPKVFAFGQRQLATGNPDWVAGVGVTWTLFDALDHDKLTAGTQRQVDQAEHSDAQARSDIALLVERNWRLLEQARRQYVSQQPSTELAQRILQLRVSGLREGTSTTLDLIDAETNVAKVQTERAQSAYEYVMALANLLEACGLSEEFSTYRARADVQVE